MATKKKETIVPKGKEDIIETAKKAVKKAAVKAAKAAVEVAEAVLDQAAEALKDAATPIITPEMAKIPAGPLELKWTNYKNHQKLVNPANKRRLDVIVVGTGLAGASAAASLAEMGFNVLNFCIQDSTPLTLPRVKPFLPALFFFGFPTPYLVHNV